MKRTAVWIIIILLLIPLSALPKGKKYRFGQVREENGNLLINFEIRDLMNQDVLLGLQKGMTAAIEYQIQLWDESPRWANRLVAEQIRRLKISYDAWERRYVVFRPGIDPEIMNEDRVIRECSELIDFNLASVNLLEPDGSYTIAIRLVLQPMSVENVEEIRRWLSGEVKQINPKAITDSENPGKKAGNWFMGLVLNLTGFGDKVITAKSPPFNWKEGTVELRGRE